MNALKGLALDSPRRFKAPLDKRFPSQADAAFWDRVSAPVFALLDEPRSWTDLSQWIRDHRFGQNRFRQVLAWLEEQGQAVSFTQREGRKETTFWVSSAWMEANIDAQQPPT